jgi:predicted DNA-binding protein (MmcQ/YjbR family)
MADSRNIDVARDWCDAMPAALLSFPFGDDAAVYKVANRVFALTTVDADPGHITVKVDPIEGEFLRDRYPFIREGYHMNKRHWITVDLVREAPMDEVRELIEESHRLVVSTLTKNGRRELGIDASDQS